MRQLRVVGWLPAGVEDRIGPRLAEKRGRGGIRRRQENLHSHEIKYRAIGILSSACLYASTNFLAGRLAC